MTTLIGMTWDHPRAYDCLVATSHAYCERTGIKITWEKRSLQAFADVPIKDLAGAYDLIILDHPHVGQIAESGCLAPLEAMDPALSVGGSVECYEWEGKSWAWPIDAACQMSVVRPDCVKNWPGTWEQLIETPHDTLRLLTPLLPVDAFDMMLTLVASLGEEVLPYSSEQFCRQANGLRALSIIKALFRRGPSEAVGWNPIKALEILSTTNEFDASPCLFGYVNYARPGFRPQQLQYVDLPVFAGKGHRRAILGGAGIGVSAIRGNVEDARDFAAFATSPEVQAGIYLLNQGQPAHRHAWQMHRENPEFSGFLAGGFNTINTAWTRPREAWFLTYVDAVCEIMPDFFLKDVPEDVFLGQLNSLYRHHYRTPKA